MPLTLAQLVQKPSGFQLVINGKITWRLENLTILGLEIRNQILREKAPHAPCQILAKTSKGRKRHQYVDMAYGHHKHMVYTSYVYSIIYIYTSGY